MIKTRKSASVVLQTALNVATLFLATFVKKTSKSKVIQRLVKNANKDHSTTKLL